MGVSCESRGDGVGTGSGSDRVKSIDSLNHLIIESFNDPMNQSVNESTDSPGRYRSRY
jgi:hypothetical protein